MARGRHRQREDGGVDPDGAAGPRLWSPHFFKIILPDTLESGKLGIPKKFLGRYGKDLSSLVLLEVLGSSTWSMGVEKLNNGTVWLWKGWQEFMQHYSIGHGHLVVFKYKGNSTFRVMIFDKSASEIDYSLSSISKLGSGFILPKREDVIEVEDSEDLATCQKKRVDPHSPCSQPSPSCSSPDLKEGIGQSRCRASHPEPNFGGPMSSWPLRSFELACEFDSEYPFFKVVIRPSYIEHHVVVRSRVYSLTILTSFLSWLNFFRKLHSVFLGSVHSHLFRKAKILYPSCQDFDILTFVLLRLLMRVTKTTMLIYILLVRLNKGMLPQSFFINHGLFKYACGQNVPRWFIRQHIQQIKEIVTLRHSNRTWPVKLRNYPSGLMQFSSGWIAFVRGTHLRVGNVCVFELINRDDIVFRVYIFSSAGRNKESKCRMNRSEPVFCDPTPSRPLTTPELAGEFDSEHPFFKLVIQQSHFKKMHVPSQFARQHIQENKKEGTLRYSDRLWSVNLSRYTREIRVFFSAGWPAFARETHLCVGNVCVFELIDRDDVVFKVSIFSSGGKDQIHID